MVAARDVALYGALCAVATFDRSELLAGVIDNPNFRHFLELVPELREVIKDFYASRYSSCLKHLNAMRDDLLLDM